MNEYMKNEQINNLEHRKITYIIKMKHIVIYILSINLHKCIIIYNTVHCIWPIHSIHLPQHIAGERKEGRLICLASCCLTISCY